MKQWLVATAALFSAPFGQALTVNYQPTPMPASVLAAHPEMSPHVVDGWISSASSLTGWQANTELWLKADTVDTRKMYIKFDLVGLPAAVDTASLFLMPFSVSASAPYPDTWLVTGSWDKSKITWYVQPPANSLGWLPYAQTGIWWGQNILSQYNAWKSGAVANNGWRWDLNWAGPYSTAFRASRYGIPSVRPYLALTFTPTITLKMPLANNARWGISTEIGSSDCKGVPDPHHTDGNVVTDSNGSVITGAFFSIDFPWTNKAVGGNNQIYAEGMAPVLAVAPGKVRLASSDITTINQKGNYVVLDLLDGSGKATGYSARYLHLRDWPSVSTGQIIAQGKIIGYMGDTGNSTGTHLHFGITYNNGSLSTTPQLAKVIMDGMILKSYQTECDSSGNRISYYGSTNVPVK